MLQTTSQHPGNDIGWLDQQGATVTLKLSVDEKSSLNPGISYGEPIFSAGIGTANSADATRTEIVAFTYSFYDLLHEKGVEKYLGKPCEDENGVFIQSNLKIRDFKIRDFIVNKVFLAKVPGTVVIDDIPGAKPKPLASPFSTFSYQITFVASFGVNGTPSWKFTRITVNPGSPFFSTSQQRTQDVTITIGKTTRASKDSPDKPSLETVNLHEAALIGQAVATAIQSQAR